jgi:predicted aspartyl protease
MIAGNIANRLTATGNRKACHVTINALDMARIMLQGSGTEFKV